VLRDLEVLRFRVLPLRAGFLAPLPAAGLRAVDARAPPPLADLARVDVDFFAVLRLAVERFAVARLAVDFRAPPLRDDVDDDERDVLVPESSSIDHLPDITRCAASATASAISEPSLVALDIMLLAA